MDNLCEVDHSNSPDALTYGHMDNLCEVDHMPTLPLALLLIISLSIPELAPLCRMVKVGGMGKASPYPRQVR